MYQYKQVPELALCFDETELYTTDELKSCVGIEEITTSLKYARDDKASEIDSLISYKLNKETPMCDNRPTIEVVFKTAAGTTEYFWLVLAKDRVWDTELVACTLLNLDSIEVTASKNMICLSFKDIKTGAIHILTYGFRVSTVREYDYYKVELLDLLEALHRPVRDKVACFDIFPDEVAAMEGLYNDYLRISDEDSNTNRACVRGLSLMGRTTVDSKNWLIFK